MQCDVCLLDMDPNETGIHDVVLKIGGHAKCMYMVYNQEENKKEEGRNGKSND